MILLLILSFSFLPAMAQEKERINWITFEQLSDSLDSNPKHVLINFHTEWCTYCRKMHQEVFTNPEIVHLVNENFYAVHFDAESVEPVLFDGQEFINREHSARRPGFHELARLLGERNGKFTVPATIFLDGEFRIQSRHFEYLNSKKLKKILVQAGNL